MTDRERQVWEDYQADPSDENRNRIVEHYLPFIHKVAGQEYARQPPCALILLDDLVTYGVLGVMDSITRFDPARGLRFTTFAGLRILGAIRDGLRQLDWLRPVRRSYLRYGAPPSQVHFSAMEQENDNGDSDNPVHYLAVTVDDNERLDRRELLKLALSGLSKIERIIVTEYYCHDRTMKEIGRGLGMSEAWVSIKMKDIKTRMRERWPNGIDAA